jgi:hypothetical protein
VSFLTGSWPRPCRLFGINHFHRAFTSSMAPVDSLSPLPAILRSTRVVAFLTLGLLGCGNARATASAQQAAAQEKQDWETEPKLWYPRAILIPRSSPPVLPESAASHPGYDSGGSLSVGDSTQPDSAIADSEKVDSSAAVANRPKGVIGTGTVGGELVIPAVKAKKRLFNLPASDSALWPVHGPEPLPGSILPEHRIVAFYGNPLSKRMGILGELPPDQMLSRLEEVATQWAATDSGQKVLPALHLIAIVAQGYPGPARKYRLQMPDSIIQRLASVVEERGWLLFLDMQVGVSTVEEELKVLVPYLRRPYVHLALDPEFAMKDGKRPGTDWMGRMDASEVNHAIDVLAKIVDEEQLPPKVLVVHRFTRNMLTNASQIRLDPRVQVVIDMDGWGSPGSKMGAYRWFVVRHPVQYTGFKLFYKNDKPMMKPEEVLELYPKPMYIQYQ